MDTDRHEEASGARVTCACVRGSQRQEPRPQDQLGVHMPAQGTGALKTQSGGPAGTQGAWRAGPRTETEHRARMTLPRKADTCSRHT